MTFEGAVRYPRPISLSSLWAHRSDMNRRVVLVPLWFLTGWMVAAMSAFVLGLPVWIAPVSAVAVAVLVALDSAGRSGRERRPLPGGQTPQTLAWRC